MQRAAVARQALGLKPPFVRAQPPRGAGIDLYRMNWSSPGKVQECRQGVSRFPSGLYYRGPVGFLEGLTELLPARIQQRV